MRLQKPADNRVKFNFKALQWGLCNCNKLVASFGWKRGETLSIKIKSREDTVYTVIDFKDNFCFQGLDKA